MEIGVNVVDCNPVTFSLASSSAFAFFFPFLLPQSGTAFLRFLVVVAVLLTGKPAVLIAFLRRKYCLAAASYLMLSAAATATKLNCLDGKLLFDGR